MNRSPPSHRLAFACALGVAAFMITGPAAARFDSARVAVEAPVVAARFPDPAVAYDTPGFRVGRDDFTLHAELMAFVAELQARTGGFTLRIIGASKEARRSRCWCLAANRLLPLTEGRTVLRATAPPSASLQVWEGR